jgi:hypothetical protein
MKARTSGRFTKAKRPKSPEFARVIVVGRTVLESVRSVQADRLLISQCDRRVPESCTYPNSTVRSAGPIANSLTNLGILLSLREHHFSPPCVTVPAAAIGAGVRRYTRSPRDRALAARANPFPSPLAVKPRSTPKTLAIFGDSIGRLLERRVIR